MIDSVLAQTYDQFELILVQGSTISDRADAIRASASKDKRIKIVEATNPTKHIVPNTNEGLSAATGDFVAFMDHDDTLSPWALNEIVVALDANPKIDLFYSDEDKLSDDGKHRSSPLFKPDFSPALITTVNYISHLNVVRRPLVEKLGGLREGFDGAQDYDFILRALTTKPVVHHIPKILYHWRQAEGSTAVHPDRKDYVEAAAMRALRNFATLMGIKADVVPVENMPTTYRYRYHLKEKPPVYVLIQGKEEQDLFLKGFSAQTAYSNYHLYDHQPIAALPGNALLLWVDPSLRPETENWLTELVSVAIQPSVGTVGGWIRDQSSRTVESWYTINGQEAQPVFAGSLPDTWYHNGHPLWPRNVLVPTPKCLMAQASVIKSLHISTDPIPSDLPSISLQLYRAGYLNVFWPYARLHATESTEPSKPFQLSTHGLPLKDPFLNPNLRIRKGSIELTPLPDKTPVIK
jgi:glycosyltransferase involved in cell wall biosynthesis